MAFIMVILSCISGCKPQSRGGVLYTHTITATDTLFYDSIFIDRPVDFTFENTSSDASVVFWFNAQKGVNHHNAASMLSSIISDNMTDEQKAISIWQFVSISGYHYDYDYNHQLQDHVDPISLVTFPYFMCGEKAGIIANLAAIAGFRSRCVGLDGHVVAEIQYGGRWHMFDADENCIFRDKKGVILSVEDLHRNLGMISEENIEYSVKDNFHGFGHYRDYIKNYRSGWIDTTSLIANYSFPTESITLYPQDKVDFTLSPTSWWFRAWNNRGLYSTKGLLSRKLSLKNSNVERIGDSTFSLINNFHYYTTNLKVTASAPIHSKVYFVYEDRLTLKTKKIYLGALNSMDGVAKKFHAPSEPDIYYNYSLIFENTLPADIDKITIEREFEFNSVIFPLHHSEGKIITIDSLGNKSLLYTITKEKRL